MDGNTTYRDSYRSFYRWDDAPSYTPANEPDEEELKVQEHNILCLKTERWLTAQQLRNLKLYFKGAPLTTDQHESITTYPQLWDVLTSYGRIRPGEYSTLKNALAEIGAGPCLDTLRKYEPKGWSSQYPGNLYGRNHAASELRGRIDMIQRERERSHLRHEAAMHEANEQQLAAMDNAKETQREREQFHLRHKAAMQKAYEQHLAAMDEMIRREKLRREQAERNLDKCREREQHLRRLHGQITATAFQYRY